VREPFGIIGRGAVVFDNELNLLASHHVAVLRHIELDAVDDLAARRGQRPCHRHHKPDFDRIFGSGAVRAAEGSHDCQASDCEIPVDHGLPPHARSLQALNDRGSVIASTARPKPSRVISTPPARGAG
jgi:hypothetical protein